MRTILYGCQQWAQEVGIPVIQLPEDNAPHFRVNTTHFPADKVSNPPKGVVLQDIDRKPRQTMARSLEMDTGECENE